MSGRISVIIPTFNDARTLPQTISSVLAQSRPADEILIINDGGTDPAVYLGDMVERLHILHQDQNRGASAARNAGLAVATGEFIHFLDSDDVVGPDFLRQTERALQAFPQAAFAIADGRRSPEAEFDAAYRTLGSNEAVADTRFLPPQGQFAHVAANPGFYLLSFTLWRKAQMVHSSTQEWLDTRLVTDEDFQMYLRTALRHGAVQLHGKMGVHRLRSNSLTKNAERVWSNRTRAMDMFLLEDDLLTVHPDAVFKIKALRSNGARRLAKTLAASGKKAQARKVLVEDVWKNTTASNRLKSALFYLKYLG